jgi:hypothetical protein
MQLDPAAEVPPRQQRIGLHWAWRPLPAMLAG